jgi:hypothetical protein
LLRSPGQLRATKRAIKCGYIAQPHKGERKKLVSDLIIFTIGWGWIDCIGDFFEMVIGEFVIEK